MKAAALVQRGRPGRGVARLAAHGRPGRGRLGDRPRRGRRRPPGRGRLQHAPATRRPARLARRAHHRAPRPPGRQPERGRWLRPRRRPSGWWTSRPGPRRTTWSRASAVGLGRKVKVGPHRHARPLRHRPAGADGRPGHPPGAAAHRPRQDVPRDPAHRVHLGERRPRGPDRARPATPPAAAAIAAALPAFVGRAAAAGARPCRR